MPPSQNSFVCQTTFDDMEKIVIDVAESRIESSMRENLLTVEHLLTTDTCLNLTGGAALGSAAGAVLGTAVVWAGAGFASEWKKWREANDTRYPDREQQVSEKKVVCVRHRVNKNCTILFTDRDFQQWMVWA